MLSSRILQAESLIIIHQNVLRPSGRQTFAWGLSPQTPLIYHLGLGGLPSLLCFFLPLLWNRPQSDHKIREQVCSVESFCLFLRDVKILVCCIRNYRFCYLSFWSFFRCYECSRFRNCIWFLKTQNLCLLKIYSFGGTIAPCRVFGVVFQYKSSWYSGALIIWVEKWTLQRGCSS